jgi:anaerobic dimethyl sulfoxide reductase subunit A
LTSPLPHTNMLPRMLSGVVNSLGALVGRRSSQPSAATTASGITVVPSGCAHNCGGHCVLNAWVQDGRIVRITTDERPDSTDDPQLRACPRGRAYLRRVYHPDRLLHPLKRVGARGEARFERVSWSEAIDLVAGAMVRVQAEHGPRAFLNMHGTGGASLFAGSRMSERLLNVFGGQLNHYNSYSSAAARWATPFSLGTDDSGHSPDDWVNAKLILLWGYNPAETVFGTNTSYRLKLARRAGARVIVIDPRLSMTAQALADEWVPLRPGTDNALMDAMAFVMIAEGLHDQAFLDRYCMGFDDEHLPAGAPPGASYKSYVLGVTDGTPKTPAWAETYTQIPAERIASLAREYATSKPAALLAGLSFNRRAFGEQPVRGTVALAAMTGNVGIPGGSAGGVSYSVARKLPIGDFPRGTNPVRESIPVFKWTDAIVRGETMGASDGVIDLPPGQHTLGRNVRFLFNTAGNTLVNQHANVNRTARILRDPSLVDFIVVIDQFMTPSARFADVVLPAVTWFEKNDACTIWGHGDSLIFMNKAIEPVGECRSDYDICASIAGRLGIGERYTEGKGELDWLEEMLRPAHEADPTFPPFDEFRRRGVHVFRHRAPHVAFREFREDPDRHPLATPSGRIEIYSQRLAEMRIEQLPPIPTFIPEWEGGPWDPLFAKYPLQAFGRHCQRRTHSIFDNVDWLEESQPHRLSMNPIDAVARGIRDGDTARVFNDRGELRVRVRITRRIIPGLVDIPQGAWWAPDALGVDRRGNVNVLTSERATPGARGNAQHSNLVQVERASA